MANLVTGSFWLHTLWGLGKLVLQTALIAIPLMIFSEVLKELNILERLTSRLHWTVKLFNLPPAAVFPLLAGLIFGLVYGAAFIIQGAKEGKLSERDLYLISLFLVINHSIFEDTLLFVAVGAKALVVLSFRFVASIIITWFVSHFLLPENPVNDVAKY